MASFHDTTWLATAFVSHVFLATVLLAFLFIGNAVCIPFFISFRIRFWFSSAFTCWFGRMINNTLVLSFAVRAIRIVAILALDSSMNMITIFDCTNIRFATFTWNAAVLQCFIIVGSDNGIDNLTLFILFVFKFGQQEAIMFFTVWASAIFAL